jgi:hypothetical protein
MGASIADTSLAAWQYPVTRLFGYLQQDSTVFGWEATELLRVSNADYLGAYDDVGIAISPVHWSGTNFDLGTAVVAGVGDPPAAASGVGFAVAELVPARRQVTFRIELPTAMNASVTVYDVGGRALRTLLAGELPAGRSTLSWDCRDADSVALASGMYFARLACAAGERSVRVPVVR